MNTEELVEQLRVSLLDDTGGTGVDWTLDASKPLLKWSNEELAGFINEAQKEVARRTLVLTDASSSMTRINLKKGKRSYDLDPKILQINYAKLDEDTYPLEAKSYKQITNRHKWYTAESRPKYYFTDWEYGKVSLYKIPDGTYTMRMQVARLPIDDVTWSIRSLPNELPDAMQYPMLYWAASLAYMKDDPNTLDPQRAEYFSGIFTAEFGMKDSFYAVNKKRSKNVNVRYGGL